MQVIHVDASVFRLDHNHDSLRGVMVYGTTVAVCYVCASLGVLPWQNIIPSTINVANQFLKAGWVQDQDKWCCPDCADRAGIEELGVGDEVYR